MNQDRLVRQFVQYKIRRIREYGTNMKPNT